MYTEPDYEARSEELFEIIRGVVERDETVDIAVRRVDEEIRAEITLQDIPYAGVALRPTRLVIDGTRIVGHPDFAELGDLLGEDEDPFYTDCKITEFEATYEMGEADTVLVIER